MGIKSEPYLSKMLSRNLYSPQNEYDINNPKLVEAIDSVTKFLSNGTSGFNNTLMSRLIGGPNTKLSQLGTIELMEALAKRVASHLRQNELPTVSMDGLNIKVSQPLSYWKITPDVGVENSISSLLESITGYTSTNNPVPSVDSLSGDSYKQKLEYHNEWLKENLGQGNKDEYNRQISKNEYSDDTNNVYGEGSNNRLNVYNNGLKGLTDKIKYDDTLEDRLTEFRGMEYPSYYPTSSINENGNENDLLVGKIGDKMSPYAVAYRHMKEDGSIKLISRGSGVFTDNTGTEFLRSFTELNQYDSPRKALKYAQPNTEERKYSTLKTVFPTVAPHVDSDYKNLMFSITNLGLREYNSISTSLNDKNAFDTMWFVPYGLTLNEQVSVGWDRVDILGRGEPIYTYNGTERKCNLSFILIADYPAELNKLNKWGNATNNDFNKFFRQDNDFGDTISPNKEDIEIKEIEMSKTREVFEPKIGENPFPSSKALKYYFDNNDFTMKTVFQNDDNLKSGEKGVADYRTRITEMVNFLNTEEGKYYKIILQGHSSKLFKSKYNKNLSYERANAVYESMRGLLDDKGDKDLIPYNDSLYSEKEIPVSALKNNRFEIIALGEGKSEVNSTELNVAMVDRYVSVYLELDVSRVSVAETNYSDDSIKSIPQQNNANSLSTEEDFRFMNPDLNMILGDEFNSDLRDNLLKTYANNIKYFRPAFHSQTPIDLNRRVTFLHQCTRQGNTENSINVDANTGNSIFGKPPVCILRLGDFLHTKILIENIDFNYEPLIWDTNPEGIGMQPMMCTVNMNCVILGGSSLGEPINKLQNALATDFYANNGIYNKNKK